MYSFYNSFRICLVSFLADTGNPFQECCSCINVNMHTGKSKLMQPINEQEENHGQKLNNKSYM